MCRYIVKGNSMKPAFIEGDRLLILPKIFCFFGFREEDMVVFREPGTGIESIKRIVGLPGKRMEIGKKKFVLQDNEFFVIGDNKNDSIDSRKFGAIKKEAIIGKILLKYLSAEKG